jgi:hypothetical protein
MFCTHVFIYLVIGKTARKIKTNRMKLTLCIFAVLVAICNLHFPDNSCEFIICRTPVVIWDIALVMFLLRHQ